MTSVSAAQPHHDTGAQFEAALAGRYPTTLIDTRAARRAGVQRLTLRPVLPQDAPLLAALITGLSPQARRLRFHGALKPSADQVRRMSCPDFHHELALVVMAHDGRHERAVADARYVVCPKGDVAEFALVVAEDWQRQGLGQWALHTLECAARAAGLQWLQGEVLDDNAPMLALARQAGFTLCPKFEDGGVQLALRALDATEDSPLPGQHRPAGLLARLMRSLWPAQGVAH